MEKMKIIFTGGGTGGHVYPNIAIYEVIKEKYPESQFLYLGTKKGAENRIIRNISQPIEFVNILSKAIPQKIKSLKTIISIFYIFFGTLKSFFIIKKFKPDIVIGSGGYASAPILFAASLLKLKIFIHEQNAVPGRLNRFVSKFATRIGVSFPSSYKYLPDNKVVITGYPLRRSIRFNRSENIKAKYDIPEKNKVVFVFGGSGGARTINRAIVEIIPMLLAIKDLTIILSTGRGYSKNYKAFDDTVRILQEMDISSDIKGKFIIREYFDNIDEIYSITDLIVSRAGAGTIKEITTLGIPSILIPKINLPDDHQILNANEVKKMGGARVVYEEVINKDNKQIIYIPGKALLNVIKETLFEGNHLFNMRKHLREGEKQNSSELILKEIEQIVLGEEKAKEKQIKIFYLQSEDTEKSYELIFDSTTFGNSFLSDVYLEINDDDILFTIRNLTNGDKLVLKRVKGKILLNGQDVNEWIEIKEGDRLEIGDKTYFLKSYFEKVEKIDFEKSTSSKIMGSSFGIIVSRIGGFLREVVIAAIFGAGRATDIFVIGLTISNFMRRIVAENALENAFLPIFQRIFHRSSRKKTWEHASSIINVTILLSFIFTIIGIILTPVILKIICPSFVEKGMMHETVNMTRLMFPYLFLVTIAAVFATYLKAFNKFGIAESSAVFFSIGTITGIWVFYSVIGIYSLALGVLLGGLMQILILIPFVTRIFRNKSLQYSYKPHISFNTQTNKKYYFQLGPISIDVFLSKTSEIVDKILASGLKIGSIAYLHFSIAIFRLPFSFISQAINGVILKEFSDKIALFEKDKAKKLFLDGIKTNLFLLTPVSILMIFLSGPIVSLLLERGKFNIFMVHNTSIALKFYSIGLIGWGIHSLTTRIFSARMDIKTSMILNFFMLLTNVGLSIYLVSTSLKFAGLALATSISFILFSFIRIVVLKSCLKKEDIFIKYKEISISFVKTLLASLFMIIVLVQAKFIFDQIEFSSKPVGNLVLIISLSFIGVSIYFLFSLMLKNTEILIFKKGLLRKKNNIPISMLSPFNFLEKVLKNPDEFKRDYYYKINIYLANRRWEVRNIGIKLIGLFKDKTKANCLIEILKSKKEKGFIKRNSLISLRELNIWNVEIKELIRKMLSDPYYEVRVAAIDYLTENITSPDDYDYFRDLIHIKLKKSTIEESISYIRLIATLGNKEDLQYLKNFYLCSNSLLREELLELFYSYYKRNILSSDETKEQINKILITSNNLMPEFKMKSIINKIYKEID